MSRIQVNMAQPFHRSISTIQSVMSERNTQLRRNISYNGTSSAWSENSIADKEYFTPIKDCLLDAKSQVDKFIKEYEHDLGAKIVLRYCDAETRFPKISAKLNNSKLQNLATVKVMLTNMYNNLAKAMKPSSLKEQFLPTLLIRAEHSIANAMLLCVNSDPDFRFEKFDQKGTSSWNDIMSAAMLIQKYLTDVSNNIAA